jgi:putative membrane protein
LIQTLADIQVLFVCGMHIFFMILEMFLWQKPLGLRIFRNTAEKARLSSALAANQGLYNGFLAAGLIWGMVNPNPDFAVQVKMFFLGCITIAGIYGGYSVNKRIFYIQSLPAVLAMYLIYVSNFQ